LTAVGIYGAISFAVSQRTRELGLRIALGARPENVVRLTLSHTLRLALIGSACGLAIALLLGEIFGKAFYLAPHEHSGMLYKVGIHDPLSLGCAASLVLLLGILACLAPTIRATRVDPNEALRYQ
jgi:ABC-type antimicrobial peptide transport system permease subunit